MRYLLPATILLTQLIMLLPLHAEGSDIRMVTAKTGLRIRESPSPEATVLTLLPDRSRVEVLGVSKEEVEIAGAKGRWVRVVYLVYTGWVFDAYLKRISTDDPVALYSKYLKRHPGKDFSSMKLTAKRFRDIFSANQSDAEHGFRLYRNYLRSAILFQTEKNQRALLKPDSIPKRELEASLKGTGLRISEFCFSGLKISEDYPWIVQNTLQGFHFDLKEYITLLDRYNPDPEAIHCDGGFPPLEDLRIEIQAYEEFALAHRSMPESREEVPQILRIRFEGYLGGDVHDPAIIVDAFEATAVLSESARISYEQYLRKNKSSQLYPVIRKLYDLAKESDFRPDTELYRFLKSDEFCRATAMPTQ